MEEENNEMLKEALDLAEETIKEVHMRAELQQIKPLRRYDSQVKPRNFLIGDLVLRKCGEARKNPREVKLAANWERPFKVTKALINGTY